MEGVENDGGLPEVFRDGADVSRGHINGHSFDFCPGSLKSCPERHQGISALSVPHENHGSGDQIQHDGEIMGPFTNADLVNGDPFELSELGTTEALLEVPFLNVLDHIPAHPKVLSRILDRHMPQKLQSISLKASCIGPSLVSKTDSDLTDHIAGHTPNPLNRKQNRNRFQPDGQGLERTLHLPTASHIPRATARASQFVSLLANLENDSAALVIGPNVIIASDAKSMVQETGGHAWVSPLAIWK